MSERTGRVVLAGGSGLIGTPLRERLVELGYEVVVLSRSAEQPGEVKWDSKTVGPWAESLEGAVGVINLAGRSVNCKWTEENRQQIVDSRLDSTRAIGDAISAARDKPKVWVNGSATGFYGTQDPKLTGDAVQLDEDSPAGTGFLSELTPRWEGAMFDHAASVRKVAIRTGIVLSRKGGALVPLETVTKAFLGGSVGSGDQWLSWIHINDLVEMFIWAMETNVSGPFNGVAAAPVTNSEFMAGMRAVLKRPWAPPAPAFAVRLVCGIFGPDPSLILDGVCVVPKRAFEAGFQWKYPLFYNFAGVKEDLFALDALYRG